MVEQIKYWIILPGLDGTGILLEKFASVAPSGVIPIILSYPQKDFSTYDDLVPLVESKFPNEPFVIVAESFSGPLAIRLASKRPSNLKALILCATFFENPVESWKKTGFNVLKRILPPIQMQKWILRLLLLGLKASREDSVRFCEAIHSVKTKYMIQRLTEVLRCDMTLELKSISVPILYLQAKYDLLVRSRNLDRILEVQPKVKNLQIEASHFLLQTKPEDAVEAIQEFLNAFS
jgi:pimeloyl-[acyl-carrier protein] methyl ester esterase